MALKDLAADYFSKINSIANRLCTDMNETKASYEDLWLTLTEDEKSQILNECIIKPEVFLKYNEPQTNCKNRNEYAVKLVVDDNYAYRDEHSAPFTFRTPSQRNLSVFSGEAKALNSSRSRDLLKPTFLKEPKIKSKGKKSPTIDVKLEEKAMDSVVDESRLLLPKTGLDLLDNW